MTTLAEHEARRAERIATAQRRMQAWNAERERVYRTALDAADRHLASAGPWRSIAPWDQPKAMAEAARARTEWETRNPAPLPPQL